MQPSGISLPIGVLWVGHTMTRRVIFCEISALFIDFSSGCNKRTACFREDLFSAKKNAGLNSGLALICLQVKHTLDFHVLEKVKCRSYTSIVQGNRRPPERMIKIMKTDEVIMEDRHRTSDKLIDMTSVFWTSSQRFLTE